jgi:DNA-binding transcriptional ArsR family regulator
MVDTALLVAFIGVAGTLSASILAVLSEPWRKKKERSAKRENLRKALYSELARILPTLYTLTFKLEVAQRTGYPERTEDEHYKILLEVFEVFNPVFENLKVGIYRLAKTDSELAVLFYELPEAYVIDSMHESIHVLSAMEKIVDLKQRWDNILSLVDGAHYKLVTAVKTGHIDRNLLIDSCDLPLDARNLEEFLRDDH